MKMFLPRQLGLLCFAAAASLVLQSSCLSAPQDQSAGLHDQFSALVSALATGGSNQPAKPLDRYGIPFLVSASKTGTAGSLQIHIGGRVKRIFLLGMTESVGVRAWTDPRDYSQRFFVGDRLGQIRLRYADGSTQDFPLILGESVWWGEPFYRYPDPFPTDATLRKALAASLHLYPASPVEDGNSIAVIAPKPVPLQSIEIEDAPDKKGFVAIAGITVESADSIPNTTALAPGTPSAEFDRFIRERPLRSSGSDESGAEQRLNRLSLALYTSNAQFRRPVTTQVPPGYAGPTVSFKGDVYANILENAFYANVDDMLAKIDPDGMYHTSTKGAVSWNGAGFGTYRTDVGMYYRDSWSRDLGRTLQELTELGYLDQATRTGDYVLHTARLWAEDLTLKYHGESLPPHWSRVINRPDSSLPFENDGHGLITMFLYKLWQRTPDRDAWLRAHWTDVKAAGDWILWQFDHPEISQATNGVLYTTGESAAGKGYSVYPDAVCMTALEALAEMADSIGETQSAMLWRDRVAQMREAISARYLITDPKYGRVWTLDFAGWPDRSTVLGPLIFLADYKGFAPEDDDPAWRSANEAAYQRLIDTYKPFGFYGQAMGYGQGFVTQAALLLDRMKDVTPMLDWAAKQIYDPRFGSFVVPEGVQIDPTGHFWYRAGDEGNGVQEAEIVKTLRLLIGVDDNQPGRLRIFPRMPYGWREMSVNRYPVLLEHQGTMETAHLEYNLRRSASRMDFQIAADKDLGKVAVRLGPFENRPSISHIRINGKQLSQTTVEHSGDSWWVRFLVQVGQETRGAGR